MKLIAAKLGRTPKHFAPGFSTRAFYTWTVGAITDQGQADAHLINAARDSLRPVTGRSPDI